MSASANVSVSVSVSVTMSVTANLLLVRVTYDWLLVTLRVKYLVHVHRYDSMIKE